MMKQSALLAAVAFLVSVGAASAQNEPAQDTMRAPTGVESTAPNNPPIGRGLSGFLCEAVSIMRARSAL